MSQEIQDRKVTKDDIKKGVFIVAPRGMWADDETSYKKDGVEGFLCLITNVKGKKVALRVGDANKKSCEQCWFDAKEGILECPAGDWHLLS